LKALDRVDSHFLSFSIDLIFSHEPSLLLLCVDEDDKLIFNMATPVGLDAEMRKLIVVSEKVRTTPCPPFELCNEAVSIWHS